MGSIGVDIVSISRVRDITARRGRRFLSRYFSSSELDYSLSKSDPYPHLAARFAAKEAAYKAFCGAGASGIPLSRFEVVMSSSEAPTLRLLDKAGGGCRECANNVSVSLSHDGDHAVAVVALFGDGSPSENRIQRYPG